MFQKWQSGKMESEEITGPWRATRLWNNINRFLVIISLMIIYVEDRVKIINFRTGRWCNCGLEI